MQIKNRRIYEENNENRLKSLIAQNELKRVIEDLFTMFSAYREKYGDKEISNFYDQLILLSGKLNGINQEIGLGIIDSNFANLEKTRINYNVLNLINKIPNQVFSPKSLAEISPDKSFDLRSRVSNELIQNDFEFDIFLSFSSKDREMAKIIWEELRGYGLKVFLSDESLKVNVGHSFFEKIQYALINSKHFVLICTPNSMESEWVKTEYETFYNEFYIGQKKSRKLIILKGNGFKMNYVPLLLRRLQFAEKVQQIIETLIDSQPYIRELESKALEEKKRKEQEELESKALEEKKRKEQEELESKALEEKKRKEQEELESKALEEKKRKEQEELESKALEEKKRKEQEELESKALEEKKRKEQEELESKALEEKKRKEQEELESKALEEKKRKEQEELESKALEEKKRKEQEELESKALEEKKRKEQEELESKALEEKKRKEQEELESKALEEKKRKEQEELESKALEENAILEFEENLEFEKSFKMLSKIKIENLSEKGLLLMGYMYQTGVGGIKNIGQSRKYFSRVSEPMRGPFFGYASRIIHRKK